MATSRNRASTSSSKNRHQPTTLHLKTYLDDRHKITIYFNRDYGEVFDLQDDPGETRNLWADADLRAELTEAFLRAEMQKEEPLSAESLSLPNKSAAMYLKSCNKRGYQINFDPAAGRYELFDLSADAGRLKNLWDDPAHGDMRAGDGGGRCSLAAGAWNRSGCHGLRGRKLVSLCKRREASIYRRASRG